MDLAPDDITTKDNTIVIDAEFFVALPEDFEFMSPYMLFRGYFAG